MVINNQLKAKVIAISDYTSEPLVLNEIEELALVMNDESAPVDERILASRVMINICENRRIRAVNQVAHFTRIHSALVHSNEKEKAKNQLINQVTNKLGAQVGLEDLLQRLLDTVRAGK